jgi:hypothetical protein
MLGLNSSDYFGRYQSNGSLLGFGSFDNGILETKGRLGTSLALIEARLESADRIDLVRYTHAEWFYQKLLSRNYWIPLMTGEARPKCMGLWTIQWEGERWLVAFGDEFLAKAHLNRSEFTPYEMGCTKLCEWAMMQGVAGVFIVESNQRMLALTPFELRFLSEGDLPPFCPAASSEDPVASSQTLTDCFSDDVLDDLEAPGLNDLGESTEIMPEIRLPEIRPLDLSFFGSLQQDLQYQSLLAKSILDSLFLFAQSNEQGDALEQELMPFDVCLGIALKGPHQALFQRQHEPSLLRVLADAGLDRVKVYYFEDHPTLSPHVTQRILPLVQF